MLKLISSIYCSTLFIFYYQLRETYEGLFESLPSAVSSSEHKKEMLLAIKNKLT